MKFIHALFLSLLAASLFAPGAMAQAIPQRATRYALILEDEPVATRFASRESMQTQAAVDYRRQLEAKHDDLRSELRSQNFTVTGSVTTTINAVFVLAAPSRLAELEGISGVHAVSPLRRYKRKLNRALALLDASTAWSAVGGISSAGAGMKIAIIDTGIDQTHAAFQDASLAIPAGFPKCGTPSDCTGFTNNKVIVARSYVSMLAAPSNPQSPAADSRPDDLSARDHDGHGTAVASIAAAYTTTGLVTFNGMAPKAYLGSYKIFGSPGVDDFTSDNVIVQALDDAISDGMDVSYASPTQINVQVPWELAGQSSAQMKVTIDFTYGNVFTIPIALHSPAFFEIAPGEVAAEDLSYTVITPSHPAIHGNTVTLYANGLGPVSNQPVSGDPSPTLPLAQTTTTPVVTFGTTPATTVSFSGLTPGIAGLYQINVTVPSTLAPGNYPLTVSIGGVTSKASGIQVK